MWSSFSQSYVLPALLLIPIVFLHGLDTILSRALPPVPVAALLQQPAFSTFGPAATHQHIDVRSSVKLCWGYTVIMLCAQLFAYDRFAQQREKRKATMKQQEHQLARMWTGAGGRRGRLLCGTYQTTLHGYSI